MHLRFSLALGRRLVLVGIVSLAGCAVHQAGFEEPLDPPATFVDEDRGEAYSTALPDRWWVAFEDETLNELIDVALGANFDLATFRDRLEAARAVVRRERSFLFPSVNYSLFAEQSRRHSDDYSSDNRFGASLAGSYEVDVWRRNRSARDSAAFRESIIAEQLKAAAISLSSEVALTWYALVEQRGQAEVLEQQIATNEQVLRVVRTRFGSGVVRASDVLRQERLLESTREQRTVVQARIDVLEHALLVLLGRSPTESIEAGRDTLPDVPLRPRLGLPSELIQRRPDVRSALYAIREADADVAVAVAARYPTVTIGLSASTIEDNIADLFDDWASLLSIDVLGPLFDAGRRESEVERTEAVKAERINVYAQTVLTSFRQVVDAVTNENAREAQIRLIERQLELAHRTSERLNREYFNGDISYIDVLDALTTEQQLQRDLLSARYARIGDRIDLYRSLAGGWDGIVPPADATVPVDASNDTSATTSSPATPPA